MKSGKTLDLFASQSVNIFGVKNYIKLWECIKSMKSDQQKKGIGIG